MSNTSTIHIMTDYDCKVFVYENEFGITKAGRYFNLELRKGDHELTFIYLYDENVVFHQSFKVDEVDCDYKLNICIVDSIK